MITSQADYEAIRKTLEALAFVRKAETDTADGRKVTGYYIRDNQIRIDIVEVSK